MINPKKIIRSVPLMVNFSLTACFLFSLPIHASSTTLKTSPCFSSDWENFQSASGSVERVVDGDTIKFLYKGKNYNVRMLSIDTPETNFRNQNQGHWAYEATDHLKALLPVGTRVKIEFEVEKCDGNRRMLGQVWKGRININKKMLESGLAVNYCIFPNTRYCQEYADVVETAQKDEEGFWSDPSLELPYNWRRRLRNGDHTKYVGNIFTFKVFRPGELSRVRVRNRVFFWRRSDVKPPYYHVD